MSPRALLLPAFAVAMFAAAPRARGAGADGGAPPVPACVAVSGQARYVPFGYNHVVVLTNGCSQDAACIVLTDVNPQPTSVEVKAGATVEVVTFMGSPSQVFTPKVSCKLR